MKKKIFLIALAALLFGAVLTGTVSAAGLLSGGVAAVAADTGMIKSGIAGNESAPLRVARTTEALIVTLPDGYRMAELIDTTGRVAWCDYLDGMPGEVVIPTTGFVPGVYIVALTDNRGGRIVRKVVW